MTRAIGMLSGGLDSSVALGLVATQGIDVLAVNFYTGFCTTEVQRRQGGRKDGTIPRNEALSRAAKARVDIEIVDIAEEYMSIVTEPRHGTGANVNPCIDCRAFMLGKARELMVREGADFVFTGEVLGQRPMSQRRSAMNLVEKDSGLLGRLVRPLSAQLLPPTIPELEGKLDRTRLLAIRGRGRSVQMRLARELGIEDYPSPAGGCCNLTDPAYARRFRDYFAHATLQRMTPEDAVLLAAGRHLRLCAGTKLIVGRTEGENAMLERYLRGRARLEAIGVRGPVALVEGDADEATRLTAASIVARYGQGRALAELEVAWREGERETRYTVAPHRDDDALDRMRI